MSVSQFYNRIIFGATAGGTGDFVVSAPATGYRSPVGNVTDETVVSYTAETADRSQWETGQGTYDSATTTVRRTTVRENSLGTTALINFSSAPIVRLDLHAQDLSAIRDHEVNAGDFSPLYRGAEWDSTDALQAAIDYAFNNGHSVVHIPQGYYAISRPLWLAPPGSYDDVDPLTGGVFTAFQFSMALVGSEGVGNDLRDGVTIETYMPDGNGVIDFNSPYADYPAIIVGPGQGMRVAGINVRGGGGSLFTTTFRSTNIGIAISGGPGGASRTVIERCWAQNCYTGFKTGWNSDALADSNTFIKCAATSCHIGYHFSKTQNYINDMHGCNANGCTTSVLSDVGKAVQIYGGNFSYASAIHVEFVIGSTTALSEVPSPRQGGIYDGVFTTTITYGGELFGFAENGFTDGDTPIYNAFVLETESFGMVPCSFSSYNSATNALTLELQEDWVLAHFGFNPDFVTNTDLEAEIQACTELLVGQRVKTFHGAGIHVYGAHIENPNSITCVLDNTTGFNGDAVASLENLYFNYNPTVDMSETARKIQSVWPFIHVNSGGGCRVLGGMFGMYLGSPPPLIVSRNSTELRFDHHSFPMPNCWLSAHGKIIDNTYETYMSRVRGLGHWDVTPFAPLVVSGTAGGKWITRSVGRYASYGNMPAPTETPVITPDHVTLLSVGPPVVEALGTYPLIYGGTTYRVRDWDEPVDGTGKLFAVSDHQFFTHGQDLTVDWSYKGQSNCLYMEDVQYMFSGLKIGLDNGGGTRWYVVTGVYPDEADTVAGLRPGYVTVTLAESNTDDPTPLVGTKTVTYTGSTVYQEAFNITRY